MKIENVTEILFIKEYVASLLALFIAIFENKKKGISDCIVVSLLAAGVAGLIVEQINYTTLPAQLCVGVLAGVFTDDAYASFSIRFPNILELIMNGLMRIIKKQINRFLGD